jgi:hypothetical protein
VRRAKRAAREEISVSRGDWARAGLARRAELLTAAAPDTIPRVDGRALSAAEFAARFEAPRRPVILTGLLEGWPAAAGAWAAPELARRFGRCRFKVGADVDGFSVRLRLADFLQYCRHPARGGADNAPLCFFEGASASRRGAAALAGDYAAPPVLARACSRSRARGGARPGAGFV